MTGILESHQMYTTSAVHFTDPFAPKGGPHTTERANWGFAWHQDPARSITPPPEMNRLSHDADPAVYKQERAYQYNDSLPSQQAYRAPGAPGPPYRPQGALHTQDINGTASQPSSRTISPIRGPRQPVFEDVRASSQRGSQANAIAPSFQIPRAVNDSGGSLAELAAEITCLFWFESADVLQAVVESPVAWQSPRQLVPDARPNTGFRKWVTTILSTTLVAQNVVILALLFIYRLKKLNPTVRGKPGSEYRLLTVALMLGNKFLDDNTYTNKTWADVSGIMVGEIHIMEVEFLSNMKYCLFTSSTEWSEWQSLLGRFAAFFERASKPPSRAPPAPGLPPMSSLYLPRTLPSPPASTQASPPYDFDAAPRGPAHAFMGQHGPTPAPSPLVPLPSIQPSQQNPLKRGHDDQSSEPPPKRMVSGLRNQASLAAYGDGAPSSGQTQQPPRLTLPSLAIPANTASPANGNQASNAAQQLPPLKVPARAMAMVYPNTSTQAPAPQLPAPVAFSSQPPSQMHSQYQSRQHSPFPGSAAASPASAVPHSALSLHPPVQVSPTHFLQQRNSPYRPVHNVSRLLYPPPSGALQHRPQDVEQSQMHYYPLGKSVQQRQTGRLPYVAQNVWLDGNRQQQPMTPIHQLPSFMAPRPQYVPPQR
ncbi:hypothetical protein B0A55_12026 [Friedmanniomyces simplex]|uniref:Cyclin N-terminal domain-containing protein n=1 Tax=Friedmanniomyces simplex TaxID=329884 RepID=A0A4U0WES2_9PEZI|nr:hypothetical protein B0A55_12428 [Friedmanniomyces simplex]TKA61171.1 hypothetical protein B0A55_12026 [Friedmanniomyces simplex]